MDSNDRAVRPRATSYTGVITGLRTIEKKNRSGTFQSFRLVSSRHKNEPEFTIDQLPQGIGEGATVDIEAEVQKHPWRSRGKLLFGFNRRVVKISFT